MNLNKLTEDVAVYMGESLLLDCESAESPFPDLQLRVSLLAPGLIAEIMRELETVPLEMSKTLNGSLSVGADGVGTLVLPDDYMRLLSVQAGSWKCPVAKPPGICLWPSPSDMELIRLRSRWSGIRNSSLKPVVAESFDTPGRRCLKLSPCSGSGETVTGRYLPRPTLDNLEELTLTPGLYLKLIEKIRKIIKNDVDNN